MFVGESRRRPCWLFFCALALVGCGATWPALPLDTLRAEGVRMAPAEGWRVVADEAVVEFGPGSGAEALVKYRGRIVRHFVAPKVHHWTERSYYDASALDGLELRARLSSPGGAEKTFEDTDAHDLPAWSSDSVMDTRIRRLEIPGIQPGSVLETETLHTYRDAGRAPHTFTFEANVPVEQARLEVRTPPGFTLEWVAEPPEFAPQTTESAVGKVYVWTRKSLPPRKTEAHTDHAGRGRERITYRLRTWPGGTPLREAADVSRWRAALNLPRAEPTPVIAARVAEILGPGPTTDPVERARRLSTWVSRKVRYVAIELGIGGWQAQSAEFTLDRLYGDCKAKAVLLRAMLAAAKVPSRLALIRSGDGVETYDPLQGAGNFNHMVLLVDLPAGPLLVDPTVPHVPFGDVPASDQDKDVLPVMAEGAEIVHQPASTADENGTRLRARLVVSEAGTSKGDFELRAQGTAAAALRASLAPQTPEARRKWAAGRVPLDGLVFDTLTSQLLEPPEERLPVDLAGTGHRRDRLVFEGDVAALRVVDLLTPCFPTATRGKRRTPAAFGPARKDEVELHLTLPPGWQARVPAEPTTLKTPAGQYTLTLRAEGETLVVQRICRRDAAALPAKAYGRFRKLEKAARSAEGSPIVLRRTHP